MVDQINIIENKEQFLEFMHELSKDYKINEEEWENKTIPEYIEQMASWIEDFSDCPANDIQWDSMDFRTFAKILYMGKIYE